MNSLLKVNISWPFFFITCFIIYVSFPNISVYSFLAIVLSLHQFLLVFFSINYIIPIRYLFGALMCLQLLLGPTFAYNGLDAYQVDQSVMQIPEESYFIYALPAVFLFIIGLHITSKKLEGEILNLEKISLIIDKNPNLSYILIGIGFISSLIAPFFGSELAFVFYLLGDLKYVGTFMTVLGSKTLKIRPLIVVYGSIIASSLGNAMFHDLIIWILFLLMIFAIRYKPSLKIKTIISILFLSMAIIIQLTKADYRTDLGVKGKKTGIQTFAKAYEESQGQGSGLINVTSLAKNNVRINQGYIVTHIMKTVPATVPFQNGDEMWQIVEAAIFPRILVPNKLTAGNQEIFMKYTGLILTKSTSMGLSSLGDAYINYGIVGGCIFMFFLGLLYSEVLKGFYRYSKNYAILLLFVPVVFYYPIRPDCELQTILGHLVKATFLIFIIFYISRKNFSNKMIGDFNWKLTNA